MSTFFQALDKKKKKKKKKEREREKKEELFRVSSYFASFSTI